MQQFVQGIGILLPYISLSLVGLFSIAKLYLFIRRKFPITVNCWFCNKYDKIPFDLRNSFICSGCKQYNGFTKDGDYNRPIPEMHYTKLNPITNCVFSEENVYGLKKTNGLCYNCNRNQELMVLQLAAFVPDNEDNFDEEVEQYRKTLEKSYRLCAQCERIVKRSLNEVKRHIVGSNMSKLGEKLHNLTSTVVPAAKKLRIIKIATYTIFAITMINFCMALNEISISSEKLIKILGMEVAHMLIVIMSYVLAVKSLFVEMILQATDNPILQGAFLYMTDIFGFVQELIGNSFDWNLLDIKEFFNILTMLATLMLIILSNNRQNLGSQVALLLFCSLKTLLDNHEKLLEPIEVDFLHTLDFICIIMTLILSYYTLGHIKETFKYNNDLNRSFHKICPEVDEESDEEVLDETTYSDSCSNLLNSTLKSQHHEYVKASGSFYGGENHFSRTPSVISASFKSPSEMNDSRMSSNKHQVITSNVGKLTQLNISQTCSTPRAFNTSMENPFYSHLNLDRQTPTSVLSYRTNAIISPPKLTRDPVSEASWVAGGFWTTSPKKSSLPANSDFMPIISRTSSQSSGFESQPGVGSRENSVEKCSPNLQMNRDMSINNGIRPIRPCPLYPGQDRPSFNTNLSFYTKNSDTFTKPLTQNIALSTSRLSLASRQSNRSLFEANSGFNDTSSLYSYRSNGRFVAPSSQHNQSYTNNSSRSIFNFKKFSTDLPHI